MSKKTLIYAALGVVAFFVIKKQLTPRTPRPNPRLKPPAVSGMGWHEFGASPYEGYSEVPFGAEQYELD